MTSDWPLQKLFIVGNSLCELPSDSRSESATLAIVQAGASGSKRSPHSGRTSAIETAAAE